jgi:hypothetical protein
MHPDLQPLFESAERKRHDLIERVRIMPVDRREARPRPKDWSPLEVVEHCRLLEEVYLQWLRETRPEDLAGRRASRHPMIPMIKFMMTRSIPSPTMPIFEPGEAASLEEIADRWQRERAELARALEGKAPTEPVLRHKMFGPLSGHQILDLYDAHLTYHLRRL